MNIHEWYYHSDWFPAAVSLNSSVILSKQVQAWNSDLPELANTLQNDDHFYSLQHIKILTLIFSNIIKHIKNPRKRFLHQGPEKTSHHFTYRHAQRIAVWAGASVHTHHLRTSTKQITKNLHGITVYNNTCKEFQSSMCKIKKLTHVFKTKPSNLMQKLWIWQPRFWFTYEVLWFPNGRNGGSAIQKNLFNPFFLH